MSRASSCKEPREMAIRLSNEGCSTKVSVVISSSSDTYPNLMWDAETGVEIRPHGPGNGRSPETQENSRSVRLGSLGIAFAVLRFWLRYSFPCFFSCCLVTDASVNCYISVQFDGCHRGAGPLSSMCVTCVAIQNPALRGPWVWVNALLLKIITGFVWTCVL